MNLSNCATADSALKYGHYSEAIKEYQNALQKEQSDSDKSSIYLGLGLAQHYLSKYDDAERSLKLAMDLAEKAHPKDSLPYAIAINGYARNLKHLENFAKAEALHLDAIRIAKEKLKPNDLLLAQFLSDLGLMQMHEGRFADAEKNLNKALGIREKAAGSLDYAEGLMNSGELSLRQNNEARAAVLLKRAISTYSKINNVHPALGIAHHHYGTALLGSGRFRESIEQFRTALKLMERELPEDHPLRIQALNALASAELRAKETTAARSDFEDALKLSNRDPVRNRSNILASSFGLGMCLSAQHDYKAAQTHFERARQLVSEAEKHNERSTVEGLLRCYLFQGKFLEALHLMPDRWKLSNESTLPMYVNILNLITGLCRQLGLQKDEHETR